MLAPIRLGVKNGDVTVSWMCNLAEHCHNEECFYARSKTGGIHYWPGFLEALKILETRFNR